MGNENFNAGCYSVAEILQKMEQKRLQKSINELVVFLLLACMCYFLTACGNWQVHFGVSEYNQNQESRGYKEKDGKSQR